MNPVEQLVRTPVAAIEFANLLLTRDDAVIGVTPKDVVWTHRKTTLYRYRSTRRTHALPVLLVFALINRPDIFVVRHLERHGDGDQREQQVGPTLSA